MMIVAKRPILYESRQYRSGDELPTKDPEMVKAWIDGGSAEKITKTPTAKAKDKGEKK